MPGWVCAAEIIFSIVNYNMRMIYHQSYSQEIVGGTFSYFFSSTFPLQLRHEAVRVRSKFRLVHPFFISKSLHPAAHPIFTVDPISCL